jgi:hypothetical protein
MKTFERPSMERRPRSVVQAEQASELHRGGNAMTTFDPAVLETRLITADGLAGMPLYDRSGDKLGVIKDIYIDKLSGQVAFVVGATGGFLGVGEKFHPLPWRALAYRTSPEGYVGAFSRKELEDAPAYDRDQLASAHYGWGDQVMRYFGSLTHQV